MTVRFSRKHSEKRQLSRFKVVDFDASSSLVDLVLTDLTSSGMSIETRRPLRVGASYPFKISNGRDSVSRTGAVRWCRLLRMIEIGGGESQVIYRSGIAFSEALGDFLPPVESPRSLPEAEPALPATLVNSRRSIAASVRCSNCRVPAVVGAKRCRICGTVLPQ